MAIKRILVVPDGMADLPCPEIDHKTPLMAAKTPNFDKLARQGVVGSVLTVPEELYPGSDVANTAILGSDPCLFPCGRGPLEAAAMGVPVDAKDVAFRCSLVSTDGEKMVDHSSGNISNEEARTLIQLVQEKLGTPKLRFYPGVGYRHLMVWANGPLETKLTPPHDILGEPFKNHLPEGEGEPTLRRLIDDSLNLLYDHPLNKKRIDQGLNPGNMVWFWGQGRPPQFTPFLTRWGMSGAVIAAVDLIKGLGVLNGLEAPTVPGATGYLNTDYAAKARAALAMLQKHDFVFVHIEAPDEAGHQGDLEAKIHSIEQVDSKVIGTLLEGLKEYDFRMLVLPDHKTPVSMRTHDRGPVPFLLYDSVALETGKHSFDESAIEDSKLHIEEGWKLLDLLMR